MARRPNGTGFSYYLSTRFVGFDLQGHPMLIILAMLLGEFSGCFD